MLVWTVVMMLLLSTLLIPRQILAWTIRDGERCDSVYGEAYVGSDGKKYYAEDSESYLIYDEKGKTSRHKEEAGYARQWFYMMNEQGEMHKVFCVEAGVDFTEEEGGYKAETGQDHKYFERLPEDARQGILETLLFGWQKGRRLPVSGINQDDYAVATQVLIWEYQQQLRTDPEKRKSNGWAPADQYYNNIKGRPAEKAYDWILEQIRAHETLPQFAAGSAAQAKVYTLQYNSESKLYALAVTDTSNTLADLVLQSGTGIHVARQGNRYTFSSEKPISQAVTVKMQKQILSQDTGFFIWGMPGYQTMVSGAKDQSFFYMKFKTEEDGGLRIRKSSEDGRVSGISFTIQGDGYQKTVTTGEDGEAELTGLHPGVYTVKENDGGEYEPWPEQTVTVEAGSVVQLTVHNVLKRGSLRVVKTSEDNQVEGVSFRLYGVSRYGTTVDMEAVTDEEGIAVFDSVPVSGTEPYLLEEVTGARYVKVDPQAVTIAWNQESIAAVYNELKKFSVSVSKRDADTGQAQGDGSLEHAEYGLYHNDELIDVYYTDGNGEFTTKSYPCGTGWVLKEIAPSEGYVLDSEAYDIGAEPEQYALVMNSIAKGVMEKAVKGQIQIVKHIDREDDTVEVDAAENGEAGGIEKPEEGAVFEIFLYASGSYEAANDWERDRVVTDEAGFAKTKELPYGRYTVHQVSGLEGYQMVPDFTVYITENGHLYNYILNNRTQISRIRIEKRDGETGNRIASSEAGFQIYDAAGQLMSQTLQYPTPMTIDTFYANEEGWLMLPQALPFGDYTLVEVQAPYGYVLDAEPVPFTVDGREEITVIKNNSPQKAKLCLEKSGEVFASVREEAGFYQPVYETRGLPGAVYEVVAAEDIRTQDGTLRFASGDTVAELITDEEGRAVSDALYLGRYVVKEVQAPDNMVLDPEPREVVLTYAGEDVSVIQHQVAFEDARYKAVMKVQKSLECPEVGLLGTQNEIRSVQFGLYAAQDLQAADGTGIPKDGCLEIAECDEEGSIIFNSDVPFGEYYVKETTTHEAYIADMKTYPMTFLYTESLSAREEIVANGGEPIMNEYKKGRVEGLKEDAEGHPIAGAVIGLFSQGASAWNEETALAVTESDTKGWFCFEDIPCGSYWIRELKAPEGYVLCEAPVEAVVSEDGQEIQICLENQRITGKLILTKSDISTGQPVPDCMIEILDTRGTVLHRSMTDDMGVVTFQLEYGDYFYREYDAPEGYVLDETAYPFSIREDGQILKAEMTNCKIQGTLRIHKVSAENRQALSDCGIEILDTVGTILYRKRTDQNGNVSFELPYGDYYYREYEAPKGYVLDEAVHAFAIGQDGQEITKTLENTTVDREQTPKTGDTGSPAAPWIFGSAISMGILIALLKIYRRKS